MTQREFYDAILYELNQYNAPDFLLEDFIYWGNKAIDNYVKKRYNFYDVNQQVTDDLAELKGNVEVKFNVTRDGNNNITTVTASMTGDETVPNVNIKPITNGRKTWEIEFELPSRYYHMSDVLLNLYVKNDWKCKGYRQGDVVTFHTTRIPAGQQKMIKSNIFYRDNYRTSFYQILNEKGKTTPKIRIMAGMLAPTFEFDSVDLFYIKIPSKLSLTQIQVDSTADTSEEMEFSDPQVREIIKECTTLLLATWGDPRIQTKPIVDQSVAPPQGPDVQLTR